MTITSCSLHFAHAIRRASGRMLFNPMANTVIETEDTLIIMGEAEQVSRLQLLAGTPP